ncbi:MAG TPA: M1 family aminopeptidase [Bacteroidia bacterium]|nr:M1 family aminopeptidase [Bacteroidia bacterium]
MKKYLCSAFALLLFACNGFALTSDTITVRHYEIRIDTINYSTQSIRANTTLTVVSKLNSVNNITLSLLHLTIDSIVSGSQQLAYTYNDTLIRITPPSVLNLNDSITLTVYYNGQPQQDASWGGFYFSGTYAFNLGVSFSQDPHTFGRVWFPCIDEFTDRSKYDFHITTPSTYKAFCNGILVDSTVNANGTLTWNWKMNHTIPSYLASVAVAPFYTLRRTFSGIPVQWAVLPQDTNATLATFTNFGTCLSSFINAYGSYPWDKVGFVMTPVVYGGMEHATSIHISKTFINGTLNYETLWAHELSHMWWGDKVTCDKEEEMWLNEGFAVFNEFYFTENHYGADAYKTAVRANHRRVLQLCHINDGNYHALNAVPHSYTYAKTVYEKGPDIAHTLRKYMGDSLFFVGCRGYMNNRAYGNATSAQLRDEMAAASSINLTRFFDDWVFTPGFPHFSIDSVVYFPGGLDHYWVYTRQRSKGNASHIYSMSVDITFSNSTTDTTVSVLIDSATNVFHIPLIGVFDFIALDRNEKVSDAISDYEKNITATGNNAFPETGMSLNVQALGANNFVRIEHNWVKPDDFQLQNPGIRLSDYHYWKVDGLFDNAFLSKATFTYDGRTPPAASAGNGYIDNTLITGTELNMVLLYRSGTADEWQPLTDTTMNIGNPNDKVGNVIIDTLRKGEYVFGYLDSTLSVPSYAREDNSIMLNVFPNPSQQTSMIEFSLPHGAKGSIFIFDSSGKIVYSTNVFSHQTFITWDCFSCPSGTYTVVLEIGKKKVSDKIVLMKK